MEDFGDTLVLPTSRFCRLAAGAGLEVVEFRLAMVQRLVLGCDELQREKCSLEEEVFLIASQYEGCKYARCEVQSKQK